MTYQPGQAVEVKIKHQADGTEFWFPAEVVETRHSGSFMERVVVKRAGTRFENCFAIECCNWLGDRLDTDFSSVRPRPAEAAPPRHESFSVEITRLALQRQAAEERAAKAEARLEQILQICGVSQGGAGSQAMNQQPKELEAIVSEVEAVFAKHGVSGAVVVASAPAHAFGMYYPNHAPLRLDGQDNIAVDAEALHAPGNRPFLASVHGLMNGTTTVANSCASVWRLLLAHIGRNTAP